MVMTEHLNWTPDELDAALAEAQAELPSLPPALQARILADAAAVQMASSTPRQTRATPKSSSGFSGLWAALGGGRGAGGLAAASLAGLWIGFTGAGGLVPATADIWSSSGEIGYVELMAGETFGETLGFGLGQEG